MTVWTIRVMGDADAQWSEWFDGLTKVDSGPTEPSPRSPCQPANEATEAVSVSGTRRARPHRRAPPARGHGG